MVPWGLGLGKRRELFRSRRTLRALPSPSYFFGAYKDQKPPRPDLPRFDRGHRTHYATHHGPTPPATLDRRVPGFQRADLFGQLAVGQSSADPSRSLPVSGKI